MARECMGVGSAGGRVIRFSGSAAHRQKHSSVFRWEWWARLALFAQFLQGAMILVLHWGMTSLLRSNSNDFQKLPSWQIFAASMAFGYDTFRAFHSVTFLGLYCYHQMEFLQLFRQHARPRRTRVVACILIGSEMMMYGSILSYGVTLLQLAQSPLDLILNIVALHFLFEIDDYLVKLAPGVGLLGDIDVPKSVVLPTYITEPQWRKDIFFYNFGKIMRYGVLDVPVFPVLLSTIGLTYDTSYYKEDPRDFKDIYSEKQTDVVGFIVLLLIWSLIPSMIPIWHSCATPSNNDSVFYSRCVKYAKIVSFLVVYLGILSYATALFVLFSTEKFEMSIWVPTLVPTSLCWSLFMTVVILLIH